MVESQQVALLISHKVKPGLEADFRAWEQEIAEAVCRCPGFKGMEVFPPVPPVQEDWVIMTRFQERDQLQGWLESSERHALLQKGEGLWAGPPALLVMAAPKTSEKAPVTAVVNQRIRPDQHERFKAWQAELEREESKFPGYLGKELFPPVPGVTEDWTVAFRFDSDEHLERWLRSDERKRVLEKTRKEFGEFHLKKIGSSFAGWFYPGEAAPPHWKQGFAVLLGVYPTVMSISLLLGPYQTGIPFPLAIFINNALTTVLLTWPVMPLINKLFRWWLYPEKKTHDVLGVGVLLLVYAACIWFFLTVSP